MRSMTGYAFNEFVSEDYNVSVEIKSYNSRFLDLSINAPFFLSRIEAVLKEEAAKYIQRGKVEIHVKLYEKNPPINVQADVELAKKYSQAVFNVMNKLNLNGAPPVEFILKQEGVLNVQKTTDENKYKSIVLPVFYLALKAHAEEREREGQALYRDIVAMTRKIEDAASFFTDYLPHMEEQFASMLKKRFAEFAVEVDEQRIAQETASLLIRYTINEEVVRLQSHLLSLKNELEHNPAPGRKIDFICQEINREINTIGSKNQLIEVAQKVIEAKDALENIKEQARNIE